MAMDLPSSVHHTISISLGFMTLAFISTWKLIPKLHQVFVRAHLTGVDVNKKNKPTIPESMGMVCALVYLVCMFLFIPFPFLEWFNGNLAHRPESSEPVQIGTFPHHKLGSFLSALLSVQSMVFLGFADDVFDIRWRYKLFLPGVASIPLLMVYFADQGGTSVVVPVPLRPILGHWLHLGVLYYVYMGMVAIFCTNAINILAGINGVEVAQSVVIGLSIVLNDLLILQYGDKSCMEAHLFSMYFLLPFIGASLGLLYHNWYPSRVFVGDTYCYFAGMIFAVVGILGHFSKTMLLMFLPQIFNFLYSAPQLFGLVKCPRHRMPILNVKTGKLEYSRTSIEKTSTLGRMCLHLFELLGLVRVTENKGTKKREINNLTLLNLILLRLGPMSERDLATAVVLVQVAGTALAFLIRYQLVHVFYDQV
ncbi:uncharacterized protein VTP21DRAFT_3530 [Calcarisporiella thermophila]|uniref:uncharacterized protein n=1 Tax=Calcarisporiella thermophila TaxID=911321 RepID=UPI0037423B36